MMQAINNFWPVLLSLLGVVVWLIRLESKVLFLEEDKKDKWEKIDKIQEKLERISESLSRLEGKIEVRGLD
jgi:hypothetical protein